MPIYKGRKPGEYRVVIWAKGKRHDFRLQCSKAEAESFEARKRLELDADHLNKRTAPTFSDFCLNQYKPYATTNLKPTTWASSRKYQLSNLIEFFGAMKLTELSTEAKEQYKRERIQHVRATTVNNELRLLGTVLRWAAELGYPTAGPKYKKLKPRGRGHVKAWTAAELEAFFEAARIVSPELLRLLVFLANTGCRKGEALAAEWSWIDFDAELIRIPATEYWEPKNGQPREVPLSDACRTVLTGTRKSNRWVFPNRDGERYATFPKDLFWRARDAAGLTGGAHKLRHTFASHFLMAVPDLFLLAQVLGHSTSRITELYSHLLPGHLGRAKNAVNLAPKLQTVSTTVSKVKATGTLPRKIGKRH